MEMKANRFFSGIAALFFAAVLFCGCGDPAPETAGKPRVTAGLPPVAHIVKCVAGDRFDVLTLLPEGKSPHDYAPGPREIRRAASSRAFFTAGMPFEDRAVKALGRVKIVDAAKEAKKIPFAEEEHHHHGHGHDHDHDHDHGHHHDHGELDPHVWLDAGNLIRMAGTVRDALCALDPAGRETFEKNHAVLVKRLGDIDGAIAKKLSPYKGQSFFVYHAAFGYFARRYGLKQTAVELGGREVAPARLAEVIRKAREAKVKTIFVQPQFNPASSTALAEAIEGRVAPLDPLAGDVEKNLLTMADAVRSGFSSGGDK